MGHLKILKTLMIAEFCFFQKNFCDYFFDGTFKIHMKPIRHWHQSLKKCQRFI